MPWFGTTLHHIVTPKPELELYNHRTHGKMYGLFDGFLGTNPTLVVGHPEAIKQVAVKHFDSFTNRRRPATWRSIRYRALTYLRDDEWRNLRKVLAPTFTSSKLKRMFEIMKTCVNNLSASIARDSQDEIDLKRIFSVYTVDVISACCFSMDLKDYRHPDSEILSSARNFFNVSRFKMFLSVAMPKQFLSLIGFDINEANSIDFFGRFARDIIAQRRKLAAANGVTNKKQDDFLQLLIDAAGRFNDRSTAQEFYKKQQDVADNTTTTTTTSDAEVSSARARERERVIPAPA